MIKSNLKSILGWIVGALIIVGIIGINMYQMQEKKTDKPVVKIGITMPLTGSMSRLGQQAKKAVELRISEIPENSKYQYKVFFEDDQLQSSKEFTNAQKLINFSNVDVMISGFSGGAAAIANLANENDVVYWHFQWTDEINKKSPFVFTYNQMPGDVVKLWLNIAHQNGVRKIAVINNETHAGGEFIINSLRELLPNYPDMEIVSVERVPLFGSDLRTVALKMNMKQPDIYLSTLLAPTLDEFAEKLKEQDIKTPISTINVFEHAKNKSLFEGFWGVGATSYNQKVLDAYERKYQEVVSSEMAPYIYDVIDIIVQAYEKNDHKLTGKELSQKLLKMGQYEGGFGIAKMDEYGILHVPVINGKIKNEKFVSSEE